METDTLRHFCFFETKSLALSYQLSQFLLPTLPHKIFEASVTPSGSILVIAFEKEANQSEVQTLFASRPDFLKQVRSWHLSLNTNRELIDGYLNQIMRPLKGHLVVVEGTTFGSVLPLVESLLRQKLELIEFRLLRSQQNRFCVSFTANDQLAELESKIAYAKSDSKHVFDSEAEVNLVPSPSQEILNQYSI